MFESFQMNYEDLVEEHKKVINKLKDVDCQLVTCMQQIQSLNRDKERKKKELDELETAARALVEVVDPAVEGRTLLERLRDAPQRITGYASGTAKVMLAHVLALIKSYVPSMNMGPLVDGAAAGYTKN